MTAFLKPYTCLVCGGKERLSMWDLERKTKPRCPHCGSLSLVRDNNLVPKPKTKKNPNPKKPRPPQSPERKAASRLRWLKRHHEDFAARRKYGWKPKAES